jgi:SAM-dependent methyltransferase
MSRVQGKRLRLLAARLRAKLWGARRRLQLLPRENFAYNRQLWELYSREWDDPRFVSGQLDPRLRSARDPGSFKVLGEEWSARSDIDAVIDEFIAPYVSGESDAAEIGVGGGRIALRVAPHVRSLVCMDISPRMLERARDALAACPNTEFRLLEESRLPADLDRTLDFIYAFDVFLHLDLHAMWRYVQDMSRALRPGGRALVHTLNLTAPGGWEMFAEQEGYSVEYGWFVSPEMVRTLVGHTDLRVIKESRDDPANQYLHRDYLAVLEKPG